MKGMSFPTAQRLDEITMLQSFMITCNLNSNFKDGRLDLV